MTDHCHNCLVAVLVASLVLLAACSGDDGGQRADDAASVTSSVVPETTVSTVDGATSPGCGRAAIESGSIQSLRSGGVRRTYVIEVPDGYDVDQPTALIVDFHGFGGTAEGQVAYSGLGSVADAVVVTPDGVGTTQAWSLLPNDANPDVTFFRDLVDTIGEQVCLDPDRVDAVGISNGSAFVSLLACHAPDLLAGVAFVATALEPTGCGAATTMPLLVFHGTADPIAIYDGGPSGTLTAPVEETVGIWAERNGCAPEPVHERLASDVTTITYDGCDADVMLYRVEGAGHVWPGGVSTPGSEARVGPNTDSIDASALMSEWFAEHPRSS